MDNAVKLVSIIAGLIGGLAQTFMSAKELSNYKKQMDKDKQVTIEYTETVEEIKEV